MPYPGLCPARRIAGRPTAAHLLATFLVLAVAAVGHAETAATVAPTTLQPRLLGVVGEVAILAANDGQTGHELWRSDGTERGTFLLADLCPGSCSTPLFAVAEAPGAGLLFLAAETPRRELWRTDGTQEGTFALAQLPGGTPVAAGAWMPGGRLLAFRGLDPATGSEPWVTDGTMAGTRPLADLVPGPAGSDPSFAGVLEGKAYFLARLPEDHRELWRTDGTPAGTMRAGELPPSVPARRASLITTVGDCLLYRRDWPQGGVTVGSHCAGAGTRLLFPYLPPYAPPFGLQPGLVQVEDGGDRLLLTIVTPEKGIQLWTSDGTPEGTRRLLEQPGNLPLRAITTAVGLADGRTVFRLHTSTRGAEPWVTDGTPKGTRRLADLCPGRCSSGGLYDLAAVGDRAVLSALGTPSGHDLWATDGTPEGTVPVADLVPEDDPPVFLPQLQGEAPWLFVVASDLPDRTLWRTDGTPGATVRLGVFASVSVLAVLPGGALLEATSRDGVGDLWWTDGTPSGTRPLDLQGEPMPGGCVADAEHLCLLAGRFRVRAEWRDPRTGDTGSAGAAPFPGSDRTGTFWFFDPANVELLVKMLDGRPVNGFFWTFYGSLSDVEYWIEVEEVATGWRRTYHNPPRRICGGADTGTLEGHPAVAAATVGGAAGVPEPTGDVPQCSDPSVLCVQEDRFRLEVTWRDPRSGDAGRGTALAGSDLVGTFWFFRQDNVELVAKVLDGRPVNGHWWVFWGALTDVEYELRVVDAVLGLERTYRSPAGDVCGGADTAAF